ncbi:hypothetical protein BDV06DRAFT_226497 [Aspergillus oleicola]
MASNTDVEPEINIDSRILLVGAPDIALNQLAEIINIHAQNNVLPCESGAPSFRHRLRAANKHNLLLESVETWTESEIAGLQVAGMRNLQAVDVFAAIADREEKILVAQVDPAYLVNPAALSCTGHDGSLPINEAKLIWNRFDLDGPPGYELGDGEFFLTKLGQNSSATKLCEMLGLDDHSVPLALLEKLQKPSEKAIKLESPSIQQLLTKGTNAFDARIAYYRET